MGTARNKASSLKPPFERTAIVTAWAPMTGSPHRTTTEGPRRLGALTGRHRRRGRGAVAVLFAACSVLAACGQDDDTASEATGPAAESSAANTDNGYPVTVENCGRTLSFDQAPSRAILSYHPMAEIFVGLGLADRAVGRAGFQSGGHGTPVPAPTLAEQADDFETIPVVSDDVYPPTKEELLALQPDFLLAYGPFDYSGEEGLASLDDLEAAGVAVYTVQCGDEAPLDDTYRTIADLGTIFGVQEVADERVAQMKAQIDKVQETIADRDPVRVFAYFGGEGPISSLGASEGLPNQLFTLAGAVNALEDTDAFLEVGLEAVAGSDVDAFIVDTSTGEADQYEQFLYDTFPSLQASQDQRSIRLDFTFTVQGWRNAQTVEDLARQLHPDAFTD